MNPEVGIDTLPGIGGKRRSAFQKLGISTVGDLLQYYPRAYEDRCSRYLISSAPGDRPVCICAMVASVPKSAHIRKGMDLLKFRAADDSGTVEITYFNQPYLKNVFHIGESFIFFGQLAGSGLRRTLTNPVYEAESRSGENTGRILPVYRLTEGLGMNLLRSSVTIAINELSHSVPEVLPEDVRSRNSLADAEFACRNIHFPDSFQSLEQARKRLVFEELFLFTCALSQNKSGTAGCKGISIPYKDPQSFYQSLPFSPTGAQQRAVSEVYSDLCSGSVMNRLIQGDVGSGKTMVAAAAVYAVSQSGYQCAFMAPTEILARQHLETMNRFLSPFRIRTALLTGSTPAAEKREIKQRLVNGEIDLIIGTHALLTDDVVFSSLALVITDEQHRFGVAQREKLTGKGSFPHTMVMSATPIPRTLALILYADLAISVIDELPPGRQKVDTFFVNESYRSRLNGFIRKQAEEGHQVFVVCPMVEETEEESVELKSATEYAKELQKVFPDLEVACIHGKMKTAEKEAVMERVVNGETDILVSTTVIEVGVDVPNATLMIVENAERFGLSQLHQLRGRVGRGKDKAWCILVSNNESEETRARLKTLCATNDGFRISEEDLRLRGPGDFFGQRQHGLPEMHIADLCGDMRVLKQAQEEANMLLEDDPELSMPNHALLKKKVGEMLQHAVGILN